MVLSSLLNRLKLFSSLKNVSSSRYGPTRGLNLTVHCEARLYTYKPVPECGFLIELAGTLF